MFSFSVGWLSVGLASVVSAMLGAAWFMGVIPKAYGVALGRTDLAGRQPEPLFIAGPFVCGLLVTLTNAVLLRSLNVTALSDALLFGLITGVGYLLATVVNVAINPNIPRPLFYGAINAPYFLVNNLAGCAILTVMA